MQRYHPLRLLCGPALLFAGQRAWAPEYHGQVFYHGYPVPGATVTMSEGAKQFSIVTDEQGLYSFPELTDGPWKIEIDMRGFAPVSGQVMVAPNIAQGKWEMKQLDLSQMLAEMKVSAAPLQSPLARRDDEKPAPVDRVSPPTEEIAEKAADGLLINGSSNNAATSKYSIAPAFGNRRLGAKSLYTGGFGTVIDNSAFDARPYFAAR
jgi:hypothetical protein